MPETNKRHQIIENIRDAFDLITTGGGYNFTVLTKVIGLRTKSEIQDAVPALMIAGADEEADNSTNSDFTSEMDVTIVGVIRSSDPEDPAIAERDLSRLITDVRKALLVDHTRGGLCRFTKIRTIETDKGNAAPYAAFDMTITVQYRSAFTAP